MPLCDQWQLKSEKVVACHANVHEVYWIHCTMCLVATTVAGITGRCTTKIVHIEGTTVPHFDVSGQPTAFPWAETHLSGDLAIHHCWMATMQPPGSRSVTPVSTRWTWRSHSCPSCSFKSVPAGTKGIVTLVVDISVRHFSASTA